MLTSVMRRSGMSESVSATMAAEAFEVFFGYRNQVVFYPETHDLLAQLASGYKLYALTNGNADIYRAGIGHFFQGAINSAGVGASKPDEQMFHAVTEAAGVSAEEVVHIGDNLIDDVSGALNAGMHAIWFNQTGAVNQHEHLVPSATVDNLGLIPAAIESIAAL